MDPTYKANAKEYLAAVKVWQAELNSWATELMFLQRMLDIYGLKAMEEPHSGQVRALKQNMSRHLKETTEQLKQILHQHEEHLALIVEDRLLLIDRELPYKHKDAERAVLECRAGFHGIQQVAFHIIEELKRF